VGHGLLRILGHTLDHDIVPHEVGFLILPEGNVVVNKLVIIISVLICIFTTYAVFPGYLLSEGRDLFQFRPAGSVREWVCFFGESLLSEVGRRLRLFGDLLLDCHVDDLGSFKFDFPDMLDRICLLFLTFLVVQSIVRNKCFGP
jgi:hypothetical protein